MVITSADGKPAVVSSKAVADLTERKAAEIGQKLGGIIVDAKVKPKPIKLVSSKVQYSHVEPWAALQ